MNITTIRGHKAFDTERELMDACKALEAEGYQTAIIEYERVSKPYVVSWRPLREKGTKWVGKIPRSYAPSHLTK